MSPLDFLKDDSAKQFITRDVPIPMYHLLYSFMKEKIINGDFEHGVQMPTEHQLAEAFDISRITAKRSLDELSEEGLVKRHRGKGTYVTHKYIPKPVNAPITGMLEGLRIMARDTEIKLIHFSEIQANKTLKEAFNLNDEELLIHTVRVRLNEGIPFAHLSSWTRKKDAGFSAEDLKTRARIDLFEQCGIKIDKIEQTISATLCNSAMANYLEYKEGQPLITLTRYSYLPNGQLIDVLEVLYRPDQFQYQMTLSGSKT